MIEIKCNNTVAKINEFGAELKSFAVNNEEYVWQGDKKFWLESSPILFPICSGLIDDTYYLDGKAYNMPKHGFAKNMMFNIEEIKENEVTFLLTDNETTKKIYPYHFEFRATYTVFDKKLEVRFDVKNLNDYDMYFSFGAHEGYVCSEGIEEYDIILPKKTTLLHSLLTKNSTLDNRKIKIIKNSDILPLNYKYFEVDGLIFENIDFDSLVLKNRNSNRAIKVTFKDFPYLLLWTMPNAPYICVEPWCGITDYDSSDQNLKTKIGIEKVLPNSVFSRTHSIEII